jgi:adenosylmethionine-8-amino-7-oxononanoate aminotransferase
MCRPDLLVLGKALSGGVMPVSAVLADDQVHFVGWKKRSSGEIISKHLNKKHSVANANRLNIRPHNKNRD